MSVLPDMYTQIPEGRRNSMILPWQTGQHHVALVQDLELLLKTYLHSMVSQYAYFDIDCSIKVSHVDHVTEMFDCSINFFCSCSSSLQTVGIL